MRDSNSFSALLVEVAKTLHAESKNIVVGLAFEQARKLSLLLCGVLSASLVFVGGLLLSIVAGAYTYDFYSVSGVVAPNTMLYVGIATMLLSACVLVVLFLPLVWGGSKKTKKEGDRISVLQLALLTFLQDLIDEGKKSSRHSANETSISKDKIAA